MIFRRLLLKGVGVVVVFFMIVLFYLVFVVDKMIWVVFVIGFLYYYNVFLCWFVD